MVVAGLLLALLGLLIAPMYIAKLLHRYFDIQTTISDDIWITGVITLEVIYMGVCFYCLSPSLY